MKEICPVLITYPVINWAIQEDEIWNFTAIREIPSRSGMWGVCSFEELGVLQHTHAHARARSHALSLSHTQKEPDYKLGAEWRRASSVSVRQEPQRLYNTRSGEEPFKMDAGNKCLSEKVNKKNCLMGYRVEGRRIRLRLPSGSYFFFSLHPGWLWGHSGTCRLLNIYQG